MDYAFFIFLAFTVRCESVSLRRQMDHIIEKQLESQGFGNHYKVLEEPPNEEMPEPFLWTRRSFHEYDPRELSEILGVPGEVYHLPEAEPILPGHTLIRPAMGMLKSSIKFPHKEWPDGSGVYGNIDNLGATYGRSERVLYSGFRRAPLDYIMVMPSEKKAAPRYNVVPIVLNMNDMERVKNKVKSAYQRLNKPTSSKLKLVLTALNNKNTNTRLQKLSNYLNSNDFEETNEELETPRAHYYQFNFKKDMLRDSQVNNVGNVGVKPEKPKNTLHNDLEAKDPKSKLQLFLANQADFNHIKVNQNAPELEDILAAVPNMDKIRRWWLYTADDNDDDKNN